MMQTRRGFLGACAGTVMLGTLGSTLSAAAGLSVFRPSSEAFSPLLGHRFTACGPTAPNDPMQLILVDLDESCQFCAQLDQFILKFDRHSGIALPSGLYTLEHPRTGQIQMYLDHIAAQPQGDHYQAVFALARTAI